MALIDCPECGGRLSTTAVSCPHCGFIIKVRKSTSSGRPKKQNENMRRLPNGFGCIKKLSGKRRKPYWAGINRGKDITGNHLYTPIGSYDTWDHAYIALENYHKNPSDPKYYNMTFDKVYDLLIEEKSKNPKGLSKNLKYCFQASYKRMDGLHNKPFREITALHLQPFLDDITQSHATLEHDKNLMNQMYMIAEKYNACEKNYAKLVSINKNDDDKPGVPFTEDQINLFWDNLSTPGMDTILILCYSGWRINEFLKMPTNMVDLENEIFTSGSKTTAGKNRQVPIHHRIYPLVKKLYEKSSTFIFPNDHGKKMSYDAYSKLFSSALATLGIYDHTPHDCRHTCASRLNRYGQNEICSRKILGHAPRDVHEKYVHKEMEDLKKAIESIP